jgi:hypothetical protein
MVTASPLFGYATLLRRSQQRARSGGHHEPPHGLRRGSPCGRCTPRHGWELLPFLRPRTPSAPCARSLMPSQSPATIPEGSCASNAPLNSFFDPLKKSRTRVQFRKDKNGLATVLGSAVAHTPRRAKRGHVCSERQEFRRDPPRSFVARSIVLRVPRSAREHELAQPILRCSSKASPSR